LYEKRLSKYHRNNPFLRELPESHPRATLDFKAVGKYSCIKNSREQRRIQDKAKRWVGHEDTLFWADDV
jgi:hypothetical protein